MQQVEEEVLENAVKSETVSAGEIASRLHREESEVVAGADRLVEQGLLEALGQGAYAATEDGRAAWRRAEKVARARVIERTGSWGGPAGGR